MALVTQKLMLYDTSILYCYEASLSHQVLSPVTAPLTPCYQGHGLLQFMPDLIGLCMPSVAVRGCLQFPHKRILVVGGGRMSLLMV